MLVLTMMMSPGYKVVWISPWQDIQHSGGERSFQVLTPLSCTWTRRGQNSVVTWTSPPASWRGQHYPRESGPQDLEYLHGKLKMSNLNPLLLSWSSKHCSLIRNSSPMKIHGFFGGVDSGWRNVGLWKVLDWRMKKYWRSNIRRFRYLNNGSVLSFVNKLYKLGKDMYLYKL